MLKTQMTIKDQPEYITQLQTYVEDISDDFGSTFSVVDPNTLANMLGFPDDFEKLTKIIQRYIPNSNIKYIKTNTLDGDYDVYLIKKLK